jgi:DnaJ-domain-containing protein 1
MTAIIFYTGFIGIYGFIIGKSFKKLNPFLMLLGMFFSIPVIAQVEQSNQQLLYIPFAIGFFTNFGNPLRKVTDFFTEIKMNIELSQANKRYKKEQKRRDKEYKKEQARENARRAKQAKQHAKQNTRKSTNQNYQNQQNNNYSEQQRQAQAEQERLRRQAEELRRQREQFQREQAQARNNQNNQSSTPNDELNPNNLDDACEILGCNRNDDLATFKKAYRYLRAMYHPDKMEQFGGRRKKQAEEEMKLINQAWVRVQQNFK